MFFLFQFGFVSHFQCCSFLQIVEFRRSSENHSKLPRSCSPRFKVNSTSNIFLYIIYFDIYAFTTLTSHVLAQYLYVCSFNYDIMFRYYYVIIMFKCYYVISIFVSFYFSRLPESDSDWVRMLQQQRKLQDVEIKKWKKVISSTVELVKEVGILIFT